MADWSSEKTLDFIEEYRKYTVLWRSLDKNYTNREEGINLYCFMQLSFILI
jgi:hypothetical protein